MEPREELVRRLTERVYLNCLNRFAPGPARFIVRLCNHDKFYEVKYGLAKIISRRSGHNLAHRSRVRPGRTDCGDFLS